MITVKIHINGIITELKGETDSTLLNTLRTNGIEVYSPCGGNGRCGKCNFMVKDTGLVPSCSYILKENIEVILPDKREAKVLVEQHRHTVVLPLMPGNASSLSVYPHGVAADIGTTTIVLYLVNLVTGVITDTRAILNPQAKYGADVITRIQFSSSHLNGLEILHNELIEALNREIKIMTLVADISENELVRFVFAGNTTMLHLLLKRSPKHLALYPFKPEFIDEQILKASELGLKAFSEAEVKVLPSVAAFVGADIVAGLASIAPDVKYRKYLFMDIGTNGELALITENEVLCCSTAAGPAFEGAKISCGMGAVTGAISAFGDNGITVIGDEKPTGICGSGLIDIVAWLLGNDKLNNEGQLKEDYVVVPESKSGTGTAITITQNDIREVQLAKSAIASGLKILLKQAGMSYEELDALFLAGGFGNYINTGSAIRIGLLPEKMRDKIITLGNTSGTGAILALKSVKFDEIVKKLLSKTRHVELASDEDFELEFAMNMFF
ncbi:MAG TPA: ASKHA domain-containing protein [Bacteroidales bacterium]|nr:ASKHA domain-containing protein [Bacteroidales bacterium]